MQQFDIIIIGKTPAGIAAAVENAQAGKKTLIVDYANSSTITLHAAKKSIQILSNLSKEKDPPKDTFTKVQLQIQQDYIQESKRLEEEKNLYIIKDSVQFISPTQISIGCDIFTAKKFIIALESILEIPAINGLDTISYLTFQNFFLQKSIPQSIIFIGCGAITLELSEVLARLGCQVIILEQKENIFTDPRIQKNIQTKLKDAGIKLITGATITHVEPECITYKKQDSQYTVKAKKIMIADNYIPDIEQLNLKKANIEYTKQEITINEYLQTSQKNIFAVGCTKNSINSAYASIIEGYLAIWNIKFPWLKRKSDSHCLPQAIVEDWEYAFCGLDEIQALHKFGKNLKIYELTNFLPDTEHESLMKIFCYKGYIVGAWCLGNHANSIIDLLYFMHTMKIPLKKIRHTLQEFPLIGETLYTLTRTARKKIKLHKLLVNFFRKKSRLKV
ncbi:Pyruvate/2-oxoglutarate dehydrogenase complex, dihydrolipoamide dehydrogenase (E3) component [Brevinema andersonii]|uniref:Pyruvate/2-oxoglutarate dehydrogenase complex, dihydrolipoamide dehydrogenase (E3) component n=1 Tax=Brevinema andersonii TaxID=34097 RepID=A0A1I1DIY6_BREAD|nr:FAD-dependent oxidoreductase [Brevinema andersonii]SFB74939.1 Pyruvate/2-oxoglutarate dehydrogenase complex, dihydrolipoamide dehydrogenase (E3) component [Brevinema andersonii]